MARKSLTDPDVDLEKLAAQQPRRRAGLRDDELAPGEVNDSSGGTDITATGTPGGGLAAGGLGGTNAGDGSTEDADLENAFGSGIYDDAADPVTEFSGPDPESGHAGGAVGGTPAGKRATPRVRGGIAPSDATGRASTIGGNPRQKSK